MAFEFPATGNVIPHQSFKCVRLLKYTEAGDYFLLATELTFMIFIMYYIVEEVLEIRTHGISYFKNPANWMDIAVIGVSRVFA